MLSANNDKNDSVESARRDNYDRLLDQLGALETEYELAWLVLRAAVQTIRTDGQRAVSLVGQGRDQRLVLRSGSDGVAEACQIVADQWRIGLQDDRPKRRGHKLFRLLH